MISIEQPPAPVSASAKSEDPAQLQRSALHDLLTLARASTLAQAQAEKKLTDAAQELKTRQKKHNAKLAKLYAQAAKELRAQATSKRQEMDALRGETRRNVEEKYEQAKAITQEKYEEAKAQLKKKFNDDLQEFTSIFESYKASLGNDGGEAQRKFAVREEALDAFRVRIEKRAKLVGARIPPMPLPLTEGTHELYDILIPKLEQACKKVDQVSSPLWCDRGVKWVMAILIGLALGGGTFFALFSMAEQSNIISAGSGGLALLLVAGGILLFANTQIGGRTSNTEEALIPAQQMIALAQGAAKSELERAQRKEHEVSGGKAGQYEKDLAQVKKKYDPIRRKLSDDVALRFAELQARYDKQVEAINQAVSAGIAYCAANEKRAVVLEKQYSALTKRLEKALALRNLKAKENYQADMRHVNKNWTEGCARIKHMIAHVSTLDASAMRDWSSPDWDSWNPPTKSSSVYRVGQLRLEGKLASSTDEFKLDLPGNVMIPALLPTAGNLFIEHDTAAREKSQDLLRTALARMLLATTPGSMRLTMIDPVGLGEGFSGFMHLAESETNLVGGRIWTSPEDISKKLSDLTEHMETVIQKYLRNAYETIDEYNAHAGELAEPYRVLVIADFPTSFSQDALEKLSAIIQAGARCGVHVLMACDAKTQNISQSLREALRTNSVWMQYIGDKLTWKDDLYGRFPFTPDGVPEEKMLTRLITKIAVEAPRSQRVEVPFKTITPSDSEIWSRSAAKGLRIPVGRSGVSRIQDFDIGRGTNQHALVAGKTGSGKSSFLNAVITNLGLWYAPDEAQMLLIDFKKGIEFKAYAEHKMPHAQAVAIESDLEFGISVLRRLDAEMERRGNMFRLVGAQDLGSYRESAPAGEPKLPRLLLVIDEFQEFFAKEDKISQDAGTLLDRIARQGRAFGVHMLLGSQTLGGGASIPRSTIGQMAVRIALQCDEADAQLILSDTNTAARLLSRPGEAIYNNAAGRPDSNTPFQVAWLSDEVREESLERISKKVTASGINYPPPLVFEGGAVADPADNAQLAAAIAAPAPEVAPPRIKLWLGLPVAIKEATFTTLGKQSGDNLLIAGPNDEAATGILATALMGAAVQVPDANFVVLDATPEDAPWANAIKNSLAAVKALAKFPVMRDVDASLAELHNEIKRRNETSEVGNRRFLVIHGLQRYRNLRKSESGYSFSMDAGEKPPAADKMLADIVKDGPSVGVHVLLWADSHAAFDRCFERNALREFDHRVLLQLSTADSSNLMDANDASQLGANRALLFSEERGVKEKCLPYAIPRAEWLAKIANAKK